MIVDPILYQQGLKLPELTNPGTAADLLAGKQLVDQFGEPLTGTMPKATHPKPTLSRSGGTVTAQHVQSAGYTEGGTTTETLTVPAAGTITGKLGTTSSLTGVSGTPPKGTGKISIDNVQQTAGYTNGFSNGTLTLDVPNLYKGRTITPSTVEQTAIGAEGVAYNAIKVAGDVNLKAENIKRGVSIFGVAGSAEVAISFFYNSYGNSNIISVDFPSSFTISGIKSGSIAFSVYYEDSDQNTCEGIGFIYNNNSSGEFFGKTLAAGSCIFLNRSISGSNTKITFSKTIPNFARFGSIFGCAL